MTTTAFSLEERKLFSEDTYVTYLETDLANGGTTSLALENPADSEVNAYLYFADLSQEDASTVTVYSDISSVSGGTAAKISNNYIGSSKTSELTSTIDSTFSGDEIHQQASYAGADTHSIIDGYKIVIPPGEAVVIEILNDGTSNSLTSIRMAWAEKPE